MIRNKDIIDEYDKRIRKVSTEVTFPLEDKYKKFIEDAIEMLTLSQIEEEAKKYDLRPGMGLSAIQVGIDKRIFVIVYEYEEGKFENYIFNCPSNPIKYLKNIYGNDFSNVVKNILFSENKNLLFDKFQSMENDSFALKRMLLELKYNIDDIN